MKLVNLEQAIDKLSTIGQQHLLSDFKELSTDERAHLLAQISSLEMDVLALQQKLLAKRNEPASHVVRPLESFHFSGNAEDKREGQKLIESGLCGCLMVAGGQGTRLGIDGPKGVVAVSVVRGKSLFQLFAERVAAASRLAGRPLPLAIMTSPLNDQPTRQHFVEHNYFGLSSDQVTFFCQGVLPLLNQNGDLFLESESSIAFGPDGNGSSLAAFVAAGIPHLPLWKQVRYVNFILVDNALADPFDAELFGFQHRLGADVVVKAIERMDPMESVGVLVLKDGKVGAVEYSELSNEERRATTESDELKHRLASISLFSFTMDFIKRMTLLSPDQIPLHLAFKANAWKFERFIFDFLAFSKHTEVLAYPRNRCFAPLKNKSGADSLQTVQKALLQRDYLVFEEITGVKTPDSSTFELSADFHYPTQELFKRWKGCSLPKIDYIES